LTKRLFLVLSVVLIPLSLFSNGPVHIIFGPSGAVWSQVLTFTVKPAIKISMDYDESQQILTEQMDLKTVVGSITLESSKKFKFSVDVLSTDGVAQEMRIPITIRLGNKVISLSQATEFNPRKQFRMTSVFFIINLEELEKEESPVVLSFTFFPF